MIDFNIPILNQKFNCSKKWSIFLRILNCKCWVKFYLNFCFEKTDLEEVR